MTRATGSDDYAPVEPEKTPTCGCVECDPLQRVLSKLRPRQVRFCFEYPKDLNGGRACVRAGYSKQGACVQATRLLSNANVQEALALIFQKIYNSEVASQHRVAVELSIMATSDMGDYFDENGNVRPIHTLQPRARRAIKSCKRTERIDRESGEKRIVWEYKLYDKESADETLLKYHGALPVRVTIEDPEQVLADVLGIPIDQLPEIGEGEADAPNAHTTENDEPGESDDSEVI